LKDYDGFAESRRKMVVAQAAHLSNWTSYIIAAFLAKDYNLSLTIWDSIVEILGDDPLQKAKLNELNELYLFRVKIFEAMGDCKKGVKFILKYKIFIVDDVRRNEALVRMYLVNK